ncbi:hypothetical protein CHUAL_014227 [Chamberlinius hualienensis]
MELLDARQFFVSLNCPDPVITGEIPEELELSKEIEGVPCFLEIAGNGQSDQQESSGSSNTLDHPYASVYVYCAECQLAFSSKTAYSLHVKQRHKGVDEEVMVDEPETEVKLCAVTPFQCSECGSNLKSKKTLRNHMQTKHQIDIQSAIKSRFCCLVCEVILSRAEDLRKHYLDVHNVTLDVESRSFNGYEEFQMWKRETEVLSSSAYVKYSGDKRHREGKYIKQIFSCQRSGHFVSHGIGQRRLKRNGSVKINGHCPARMHVTKWKDGLVEVSFTKTHLGHEIVVDSNLVEEHRMLEEAKAKLGKEINSIIFQCQTMGELDEIRKSLEPAKSTIAVMKRKRRRAELRSLYGSIPRRKKKLAQME